METPSSMRRVTRSQTSAATSQKNEQEDDVPSSRNGERLPLLDITNDSPIVGLATGSLIEKTPSSCVVKSRFGAKRSTPVSGEALLRRQVKALLQKVEEEAELVNNHPSGHPTASFRAPLGLPDSSTQQLLAPTPANTPHIPNISGLEEDRVPVDANTPWVIGHATIHQQEESLDLQECLINRALLFEDSPEKSDASKISSSLTCQGRPTSIEEEDDDEDIVGDEEEIYNDEGEEDVYEEEEDELFHNLCEGLSKISAQDMVRLPECTGKRTRFIYNSDDEIEGAEEVTEEKGVSLDVLFTFEGLPAPDEEEEED